MTRARTPLPSLLMTMDVAHPPMPPADVEAQLLRAILDAESTGFRVLKVIHGYGSSQKGGRTREIVRSWAFRQRKRIRGVIEGEEYSMYHPATQELRKEVGDYPDHDLVKPNPGITILWIR